MINGLNSHHLLFIMIINSCWGLFRFVFFFFFNQFISPLCALYKHLNDDQTSMSLHSAGAARFICP